ncbi:hypothetical protein EMPS_03963 [Entomortierella parvispora]|uniref:Uncharacterized protein n=1 Tax=Entomortierella parvispora TaxID=205924 RepID=A0A9P3H7T3_9FUNG|nr:hypothetical protein EMPS_03963 [Entomortierella parvispora]
MASPLPTTKNNLSNYAPSTDQVVREVDIAHSPTMPSVETVGSTLSEPSAVDDYRSDNEESESEENDSSDGLQSSDPSNDGSTVGALMPDPFMELLQSMNRLTLNRLDLGEYDRGERRLIDQERCRRKALGPVLPVTVAAAERKKRKRARRNQRRAVRAEYDGRHLHEHLVMALEEEDGDGIPAYDLVYDSDLGDTTPRVHYGNRENKALFLCYACRPTRRQQDEQRRAVSTKRIPRVWTSSVVFTEYWLVSHDTDPIDSTPTPTDTADTADTTRYRVVIHAQKCRCCERYIKPKLMPKKFVHKTIQAFNLWTGRRNWVHDAADDYLNLHRSVGQHDSTRCHGCEIGRCRRLC